MCRHDGTDNRRFGVYWNWLKADPWFPIRVYWHLLHPRSPLSSSNLVKNAFFCDEYPIERVSAFEKLMSTFESLIWPSSMMSRFVSVKKILQHVSVYLDRPAVLIMAAEKSRLMGVPMMRSMADEYAVGVRDILLQQGEDASSSQVAQAVSFEVVSGVGHHLQNDLNWREGAEKLAKFYQGNTVYDHEILRERSQGVQKYSTMLCTFLPEHFLFFWWLQADYDRILKGATKPMLRERFLRRPRDACCNAP